MKKTSNKKTAMVFVLCILSFMSITLVSADVGDVFDLDPPPLPDPESDCPIPDDCNVGDTLTSQDGEWVCIQADSVCEEFVDGGDTHEEDFTFNIVKDPLTQSIPLDELLHYEIDFEYNERYLYFKFYLDDEPVKPYLEFQPTVPGSDFYFEPVESPLTQQYSLEEAVVYENVPSDVEDNELYFRFFHGGEIIEIGGDNWFKVTQLSDYEIPSEYVDTEGIFGVEAFIYEDASDSLTEDFRQYRDGRSWLRNDYIPEHDGRLQFEFPIENVGKELRVRAVLTDEASEQIDESIEKEDTWIVEGDEEWTDWQSYEGCWYNENSWYEEGEGQEACQSGDNYVWEYRDTEDINTDNLICGGIWYRCEDGQYVPSVDHDYVDDEDIGPEYNYKSCWENQDNWEPKTEGFECDDSSLSYYDDITLGSENDIICNGEWRRCLSSEERGGRWQTGPWNCPDEDCTRSVYCHSNREVIDDSHCDSSTKPETNINDVWGEWESHTECFDMEEKYYEKGKGTYFCLNGKDVWEYRNANIEDGQICEAEWRECDGETNGY